MSGALLMAGCGADEVREFVVANHYSSRMPSNIQTREFVFAWREAGGGLFGDCGPLHAVAIYGFPSGGTWPVDVLELQRLVRSPSLSLQLSQFVAWTLRWLKKRTEYAGVVSYADPNAGHHGGIYQALNFDYVGQSSERRLGFKLPDGSVIHRTSARKLVSGAKSDRDIIACRPDWELLRGEGKHLYVLPLKSKRKAFHARFGWTALPYPKPNRAVEAAE